MAVAGMAGQCLLAQQLLWHLLCCCIEVYALAIVLRLLLLLLQASQVGTLSRASTPSCPPTGRQTLSTCCWCMPCVPACSRAVSGAARVATQGLRASHREK
jgi:hypothetical protein